jgi:SAM-dependent methyltransferase
VHELALQAPDGHPLGDGYDVVACRSCGTGFADVAASLDFYDSYYAESAKYAHEADLESPPADPDATSDNRVQVAESEHTAARLDAVAERIITFLPHTGARVLDVGCATGTLLAALRRRGVADVVGLDPSTDSRDIAAAVHGVRVEVGTLSAMPDDLGLFDCITMIGVLEHLWDVDEALRIVTDHLRPDGILYVDVPDASSYLDPYIAPYQDFGIEHINHFSAQSMRILARRHGFETEGLVRWQPELVPGHPCSAIATAWRRTSDPQLLPQDDTQLRETLYAFAARSAADFAEIDARLEEELADDEEFAVWGAGEFTMKLLTLPALQRRRLTEVVDANGARCGLRFGGRTVNSPASLTGSTAPVVVGSLLSGNAIRRAVEAMGCRAVTCSAGSRRSGAGTPP